MKYRHLTLEERHTIETRYKLKDSTTAIASALSRSQSTISRELRRNRGQISKRMTKPSSAMRISLKQLS